jgi:phosphoserine phosphatase RsbU/P
MPGIEGAARSELLLKLARQVTGRHDLEDVLGEVFRCLRPMVAFGGGSIQLLDDDGWIQMAAADPVAPAHVMAQRIPLGASVAGRVILTEQPVYLPDVAEHLQGSDQKTAVSTDVRSYFGVPLIADGRAVGVMQIDSPTADAWTMDERAAVLAAAPSVSAAIQNARAQARVRDALERAESVEQRLAAARSLVDAARGAVLHGDRAELERQLARIDAMLSGEVSVMKMLRLPQQRETEATTPVAH